MSDGFSNPKTVMIVTMIIFIMNNHVDDDAHDRDDSY